MLRKFTINIRGIFILPTSNYPDRAEKSFYNSENQLFGRLHKQLQTGGKGCTQPEEEIGRVAS